MPTVRELWSLVAYGFLYVRMARTGYGEMLCACLAFLVGSAALYALDALAVDERDIRSWPAKTRQSFRSMFLILLLGTIVLVIAGKTVGFQH